MPGKEDILTKNVTSSLSSYHLREDMHKNIKKLLPFTVKLNKLKCFILSKESRTPEAQSPS